ncbi:MAG: ATP12 family chaperone protein, partial [Methylobacterium organophilum]|nr:ATP12 family chaperone protein [Methylobacterium organophilum]
MTGWVPKRFWTEARALPVAGGFGVSLDDRPLRTPGRAPLV